MPVTIKTPLPGAYAPRRIDNARGILLMSLGFFLFSVVDAGAKVLTENLHAVQIVWVRQLGLLAIVAVLLLRHGPGILRSRAPVRQVARGVVAAGSALLFVIAVGYVPLADAVAVSFVAPLIVTALGGVMLGERVGPRRWAAVLIGLAATLLILRPGAGVVHPAAALVVIAATFFAIRQIISRTVSGVDPLETTVAYTALTASALLSLPLVFVWEWPTGREIAVLTLVAALAGLAEYLVIRALDIAEAVVLAPLHYSLIVWGTLWGFLVFGDLPDGWTFVGAAVIVASGLYTLHRERQAAREIRKPGASP